MYLLGCDIGTQSTKSVLVVPKVFLWTKMVM